MRLIEPCSTIVGGVLLLMLDIKTVWIDIDIVSCIVGDNVQTSLGVFLYHL
jgi:hypothetical protein